MTQDQQAAAIIMSLPGWTGMNNRDHTICLMVIKKTLPLYPSHLTPKEAHLSIYHFWVDVDRKTPVLMITNIDLR